jgi:YD repeat-containing protein
MNRPDITNRVETDGSKVQRHTYPNNYWEEFIWDKDGKEIGHKTSEGIDWRYSTDKDGNPIARSYVNGVFEKEWKLDG